MRRHDQLSLEQSYIEHSHATELAKISQILSLHPALADLVEKDLVRGLVCPRTGARGMSGDQVLRVLLLKQMNSFSYRELAFHLADSVTYRTFCRFGALEPTPTRATLAENLKKVTPETLKASGQHGGGDQRACPHGFQPAVGRSAGPDAAAPTRQQTLRF